MSDQAIDPSQVPANQVAGEVFDVLCRQHRWIDNEVAKILMLLNRGDAVASMARLGKLGAVLRRHVAAEDEILAPHFAAIAGAVSGGAVEIMRHDHQDIRTQLKRVEDALIENSPETSKAAVYAATLSAMLAKHEYHEENNLFPRWREALTPQPPAEHTQLLAQMTAAVELAV